MTASDVLSDVLSVLKDEWNSGSTGTFTPKFVKITDMKRGDFNEAKDWVIAHRPNTEMSPAGVGDQNKHEFVNFNLDVRTLGQDDEPHWLDVIREIKRIIKSKKVNPLPLEYPETHVLEFNGVSQDLSDKTHHLWRKLIPIQFERYVVIRG